MSASRVGINRMVITTPGLFIKPDQMAMSVSEKEVHATLKKEADAAKAAGKEWRQPTAAEVREMIIKAAPVNESKMRKGIGIETIRLPGFSESNATFVADSIYDFVKGVVGDKAALKKLTAEPVKSIYFGTESNPDRSRPELEVALMLAFSKLLAEDEKRYRPIVEMFRHARVVPITYACVGGVISLHEATTRVRLACDNGSPESSVVISADTAYYNVKKAPGAEVTQGAAATLMWVTRDPEFVEISEKSGNFHMTLSDFTKFVDEMPYVHGKFSEIVYVYTVGRALENLEGELGAGKSRGAGILKGLDFFICHVPFPKQAIYLGSFLFVHQMKLSNPALQKEIEARPNIGPEPLDKSKYSHLTDMIESKFNVFNRGPAHQNENEVVKHIENDPEIKAYWDWLKKIRDAPEFEGFINSLNIKQALVLPSQIGNSYSSSAPVSLASLASNAFAGAGDGGVYERKGILAGYGSGAQATVYPIKIVAKHERVGALLKVLINTDKKFALTVQQYEELHRIHVGGDAARLTSGEDLVEKDKKFLNLEVLPQGFHVVKRNEDGTGEYVYSDGASIRPVKIMH